MLYTTLKIGQEEYKLRATAAPLVELENKLGGRNPLQILMTVENGEFPSVGSLLLILHAALQKYHHGFKMEDVYNLYDKYVDEGNTYTDLIPVMIETFRVSGFFKAASQETAKETGPIVAPIQ